MKLKHFYLGKRGSGRASIHYVSCGREVDLIATERPYLLFGYSSCSWGRAGIPSEATAALLLWHATRDAPTVCDLFRGFAGEVVEHLPDIWILSDRFIWNWVRENQAMREVMNGRVLPKLGPGQEQTPM